MYGAVSAMLRSDGARKRPMSLARAVRSNTPWLGSGYAPVPPTL